MHCQTWAFWVMGDGDFMSSQCNIATKVHTFVAVGKKSVASRSAIMLKGNDAYSLQLMES